MLTMPRDDKGRPTIRSVSDALNILERRGFRDTGSRLSFGAAAITLPNHELVWCSSIRIDPTDFRQIVALPAAVKFRASKDGNRLFMPMDQIDGAVVDWDGNVTLLDGTSVRGVEVVPTPLPFELNGGHKLILDLALEHLGKKQQCYRALDPKLFPNILVLDYARLPLIENDKLEALVEYVQSEFRKRTLRPPTRQTIANVLYTCGVRIPRCKLPKGRSLLAPPLPQLI